MLWGTTRYTIRLAKSLLIQYYIETVYCDLLKGKKKQKKTKRKRQAGKEKLLGFTWLSGLSSYIVENGSFDDNAKLVLLCWKILKK